MLLEEKVGVFLLGGISIKLYFIKEKNTIKISERKESIRSKTTASVQWTATAKDNSMLNRQKQHA